MADERKSGYCEHCNEQRVVFRHGTNHVLHLILSIITCGMWLIVWLGSAIKIGGWRCQMCGSKFVKRVR